MTLEERKIEAIHKIESAFADVKLGDGTSLHQAKAIDDHCSADEIERAREFDPWETWQAIPTSVLVKCGSVLAHMEPSGFRFHLPAYMRAAVQAFPNDPNNFFGSCIFHLTREPQYVIKEYDLTPEQVAAIAKFWELQFDFDDTNYGSQHEKRLLDWLAAAQAV